VDQINKNELPGYYALSDIVLVTLRKLPLFQHVIPSKLFEIMAMKRPIIISVDGEARKIVETAQSGLYCEPEYPEALKSRIKELYEDIEKRDCLGENGYKYVLKNFNRNTLADNYLEILKNVQKD
jgi:glycosyltransferase involved in cell wall biosynthesis